ncbi:MAG TPA: efflux RND transporter periplasmic adaptor subunit [Hyphomonadaceae bacterium]|nr:efflux RND transporter periplasmic adaptor subunit [Hyphomonadaceae bacterium]
MPVDIKDPETKVHDILPPDEEEDVKQPSGLAKLIQKRKGLIFTGVIVLAALAVWLIMGSMGAKKEEIVTATVAKGDIEQSVLATGVLEPFKLVSVGAQASGQVKKLYVQLGDTVKAGDPIADIDSRTQTNTVQNAQAGLSNVSAQKTSAEAALIKAQQDFTRQEKLYNAGAAAQADYQAAKATLSNAQAAVKQADAQIKQASLTLNTAQTNLGYTKIVAPMDGVIVAVITEEGQTVNANQSAPTIVKLAQVDQMTVSAEISEADVDKVTAGQTVYFTTLGDTRTKHFAKLRTIAPAPDSIATETTQSVSSSSTSAVYYNGLFDVDNKDGKLKTGMTAQVYVVQASAQDTLIVPSSALERKGRGQYAVKVVGADGKPVERPVKVGITTSVSAQILSGLQEGEKVVVAQASGEKGGTQGNRNGQQRNPLAPGGPRGFGGGRGG